MEFLFCIALALAVAVLAVILLHDRGYRKEPAPTGNSYGDMFRIVELQNGMYRVQRWEKHRNVWETPFGHNTFDTLAEAQEKKAWFIGNMAEAEGYRVKRVVD